mmetsp:Transcript_17475/g.39570  ORF Transcript_17475/g.39570 Transcript_17475/m.39570 type:complete len:419 (-) Transcript_17475:34-1290(-)
MTASLPEQDEIIRLYAPFVRDSPAWSLYEVTKTFLTSILLLPLRVVFLGFFLILLLIFSIASKSCDYVINAFMPHSGEGAMPAMAMLAMLLQRSMYACIRFLIRAGIFVSFGVFRVTTTSSSHSIHQVEKVHDMPRPALYVANHLGWLDILVLLSQFGCTFVAHKYINDIPFVGSIARALGVLFVGQGESSSEIVKQKILATYDCISKNCPRCRKCYPPIVIFPEGTTTNGLGMLTFRTGAFVSSIPVSPVCIRFASSRRFNACWETIPFSLHLFRTMTQVHNNMQLILLPPAKVSQDPNRVEATQARYFADMVQLSMADCMLKHWGLPAPTSEKKQAELLRASMQQASHTAAACMPAIGRGEGTFPVWKLNRKHKMLFHQWVLGKKKDKDVLEEYCSLLASDKSLVSSAIGFFRLTP